MAKTPNRSMRIAGYIWNPAIRKSKRIGTPLTRVVARFLWKWSQDQRELERSNKANKCHGTRDQSP